MSGQLLVNIKTLLLDRLGDLDVPSKTNNIRIMMDEAPAATAGMIFVSISLDGWNEADGNSVNLGKAELGVRICITQRARVSPEDRDSDNLLVRAYKALSPLSRTIRGLVHGNMALLADTPSIEPLRWTGTEGPTPRDKSWFGSEDPNDIDAQPAGYSVTLQFRGALEIFEVPCD